MSRLRPKTLLHWGLHISSRYCTSWLMRRRHGFLMLPTLLRRFFLNYFNYYCGKIFCVIFVFFCGYTDAIYCYSRQFSFELSRIDVVPFNIIFDNAYRLQTTWEDRKIKLLKIKKIIKSSLLCAKWGIISWVQVVASLRQSYVICVIIIHRSAPLDDRSLAPPVTDAVARSTDTNSAVGTDWQTNGCSAQSTDGAVHSCANDRAEFHNIKYRKFRGKDLGYSCILNSLMPTVAI